LTNAVLAASGGIGLLPILLIVFVLMWLFMIRPQRARQRAQQEQLRNVAVGKEIVTTGGLIGTVAAVGDDELTLEIAPGTHVRVVRRSVAGILTPEAEAEDEDEDEDLEEAYDEGDEVDEAPEVETTERKRG
jgi:preprotein translocase subunit YajC